MTLGVLDPGNTLGSRLGNRNTVTSRHGPRKTGVGDPRKQWWIIGTIGVLDLRKTGGSRPGPSNTWGSRS